MPELPEVETIARGLAPALEGRRFAKVVLRRGDLRIPFPEHFAETLEGRKIERISRKAKYLLFSLEGRVTLIAHLGMSGRMVLRGDAENPAKHDHVLCAFDQGPALIYHDPRRFGLMTLADTDALAAHPLLRELAPDPLGEDFCLENLAKSLKKRAQPIKVALLDQRVVSGIGNIYASEALFRARIHPLTPANAIDKHNISLLMDAARETLQEAINAGGSTLKDYARASGEPGYFQTRFLVYDREGKACTNCHSRIARSTLAGRSTFFCATCQPLGQ